MAKLNGVQIKNIKTWMGHEGEASQGDVWLNGKKLGFWSQDGNGSICDDFDFDESQLDKACLDFQAGFPDSYSLKEYCKDKETFLSSVLMLTEIEKNLKKAFKKGYSVVIHVTDGFHFSWLSIRDDDDDERLLRTYKKDVDEMRKKMFTNTEPAVNIFRPGEFNITVDAAHPAPAYFQVI